MFRDSHDAADSILADAVVSLYSSLSSATELYGLTFGNRIDDLLGRGLHQKTMTFIYGKGADSMLNVLCGNAVQIYGGHAIFVDAGNCYDPYTITRKCAYIKRSRNQLSAKQLLSSISVSRMFTCYQLADFVTQKLGGLIKKRSTTKGKEFRSVFVSGISTVFNEQDNTEVETNKLQLLMARSLHGIAAEKKNGVLFVVCSSSTRSEHFVSESDTSIKLYSEKKNGREKAILMKHYEREFTEIEL
jgi:hypothetical protein